MSFICDSLTMNTSTISAVRGWSKNKYCIGNLQNVNFVEDCKL